MNYIFSKAIDTIFDNNGISLSPIGINNWAMNKEKALFVLDYFRKINVPILGGDVFALIGNEISITYDNWYINPDGSEEFIQKSIIYAEQYIVNYASTINSAALFSIVPELSMIK